MFYCKACNKDEYECFCYKTPLFKKCDVCNRYQPFCICKSSSNPISDKKEQSKSADVLNELKPPKLADQLLEIAQLASGDQLDGRSAYLFFIERAKSAAKEGNFNIVFSENRLPWSWEEIEMATKLLYQDNFSVLISGLDYRSIQISWAPKQAK
jgi:hypothetical protein